MESSALSTARRPLPLTLLGALYALAAFAALENLMLNWHLSGHLTWLFVVVALLYLALSFLFFARSRWLIPLAALLLAGDLGLWSYRMLAHGTVLWLALLIIALNTAVLGYLWVIRARLNDSTYGRWVFGASLLLLCVMLWAAISSV